MAGDKVPNPPLQFRLPREGQRPGGAVRRQAAADGHRQGDPRRADAGDPDGLSLDGKLCNVKDILKAAGLRFADEV
jgi:hypothetical protein